MSEFNSAIHAVSRKSAPATNERKYMAGTAFMAEPPSCPQCGSETFTLHGSAITSLRKIYENGNAALATLADVTLKDSELFWPDSLECNQCGTTTYYK
jgi:hypothetical protein